VPLKFVARVRSRAPSRPFVGRLRFGVGLAAVVALLLTAVGSASAYALNPITNALRELLRVAPRH